MDMAILEGASPRGNLVKLDPHANRKPTSPPNSMGRSLDRFEASQISLHEGEDKLRWGHAPKGNFTLKEAYNLIIPQQLPPPTPSGSKSRNIISSQKFQPSFGL